MVLGEPQILGQMKDAVRAADEAGALGTTLQPAVPALLRGGQGSAQLHRDRRPLDQHGRRRGAPGQRSCSKTCGEIARAVRRRRRDDRAGGDALRRRAARKRMAIANRTLERGEKLAARFGGEAMRLADLPARLHEFDIVVSLHRQHAAASSAWARSSAR